MKMQIEDLMDLYVGEDAAELGERLPPLRNPEKAAGSPRFQGKSTPMSGEPWALPRRF